MAKFFLVTTTSDLGNDQTVTGDLAAETQDGGGLSLREAITLANASAGLDIINFATGAGDAFENGGLIRLSGTEIGITDSLAIKGLTDGASGEPLIVISADANGDDMTLAADPATAYDDTWITDVAASGAGLLDDNSRIFTVAGELTLNGLALTGGRTTAANEHGGALNSNGEVILEDTVIAGNSTMGASAKGGGFASVGDVELINSTVSGNSTEGNDSHGGGFFTENTATLIGSTISGNHTEGEIAAGGGFMSSDNVLLTYSTISGNRTEGSDSAGGGFYTLNTPGTARLTNSTIAGNSTEGTNAHGGGVYSREDIIVNNSTITGNRASGTGAEGGGIYVTNDVHFWHSIVLGNQSDVHAEFSALAASYLNRNIIGADSSAFDASVSAAVINADPAVVFAALNTSPGAPAGAGLLADNGGPVQTVALKMDATNPAIDAAFGGTVPIADARGLGRFDFPGVDNTGAASGVADVGAFEVQSPDTTPPDAPSTPDMTAATDTGLLDNDDLTSNLTPAFTGTGEAGATVHIYADANGNLRFDQGTDILLGDTGVDMSGEWAVTTAPGSLTDGTYQIRAEQTDQAGNLSAASTALEVTIDNTAPVFAAGGTGAVNVAENTRAVMTLGVTDASPLRFAITGGADQALFDLDAASGALSFKVAPDFEGATKSADGDNDYLVTVTASDLAGLTATQDITVSVTDVNENAGGGGGGGTPDPIEPNDPVTPNDPIEGTDTNDIITLDGLAGPVTVNGGDGEDTVIVEQPISEVAIGLSPGGYTFTTPDGLVITVDNVENIQFNDRSIMMDTSPEAKVVLFMYEVLLDRLMDLEGLSSWLGAFGGGSSFGEIADGFLNSPEFVQSYGDLSNDAFVTLLYDSAFDRAPDQAGFDAWLAGLNDGTLTRGDVAAAFAQSTEMGNQFQNHLDDGVFVLA